MKSILILGSHGQVSTYLQRVLGDEYSLVVVGRDRIDLSQPEEIRAALDAYTPSLIINPAAYTAVDQAEEESDLAYLINRDAVRELAHFSRDTRTPLIHYSTDYVFDGQASEPYREEDTPAPTGVYGHSKYAGEQEILKAGAPALVLRTSWVYSNHGKNFYRTMLNLAESRKELSVVADQTGAPTYAGSIANATRSLVDIIFRQEGITEAQVGVYHFSCGGQTSWCEFARALFAENDIADITINAITTEEYPTPAKRPAYSVLDGSKLEQVFGIALPDWRDALHDCAAETRETGAQ